MRHPFRRLSLIAGVLCACLPLSLREVSAMEPSAARPGNSATANAAKVMHLRPRYARIYTDPGVELAEKNYQYRTLDWDIPLNQAAVVCVDCWNWHFSRETLERTEELTEKNIAPLLAACRAQGLLVIHTPASPVAERHPNFLRLKPAGAKPQAPKHLATSNVNIRSGVVCPTSTLSWRRNSSNTRLPPRT